LRFLHQIAKRTLLSSTRLIKTAPEGPYHVQWYFHLQLGKGKVSNHSLALSGCNGSDQKATSPVNQALPDFLNLRAVLFPPTGTIAASGEKPNL
jgi:hypothetical protein